MIYKIYGQNENEKKVLITTITSNNQVYANKVVDMLFDFQEWSSYDIFYDTLWAEKGE